ncbi:50S ribosomal protein L16 [Candidatus Woesearchaeota archaeon]|nr:50S ribosomal protein L16 [Candidatus Woesearchaeota archaeon]
MAKLRKFKCYKTVKRPFTRFSKYRQLSYVRSRPVVRMSRHVTGEQKDYNATVHLVSTQRIQVRDHALESARQATNRSLERNVGKGFYFFRIRTYPHHILRENPLAKGAGADRLSTGMSHAFGKSIGRAAQVGIGQELMSVYLDKAKVPEARRALKLASYKLPCKCKVVVQ